MFKDIFKNVGTYLTIWVCCFYIYGTFAPPCCILIVVFICGPNETTWIKVYGSFWSTVVGVTLFLRNFSVMEVSMLFNQYFLFISAIILTIVAKTFFLSQIKLHMPACLLWNYGPQNTALLA